MYFASQESDLPSSNNKVTESIMNKDIKGNFINQTKQNSFLRDTMIYFLSFSRTENNLSNNSITSLLNDTQKRQLDHVSERMQVSKFRYNYTGIIGKNKNHQRHLFYVSFSRR